MTCAWIVMSRLIRGDHLLRFTSTGKVHERFFQLSADLRKLTWFSSLSDMQTNLVLKRKQKTREIFLSHVKEIKHISPSAHINTLHSSTAARITSFLDRDKSGVGEGKHNEESGGTSLWNESKEGGNSEVGLGRGIVGPSSQVKSILYLYKFFQFG